MKIKIYFMFSSLLLLISCQRIIDNYWENQAQENYTSPYMGNWAGKYSGEENGDLIIKVAKDGRISGNYGLSSEIMTGAVLDNGDLLQVHSIHSNFTLLGNFRNQNGNASGTWKQNEAKGTWTLKKQ